MVVRICSQLRPGLNIAYDVMNATLPIAGKPDATTARFCSATPISTNRSGNSFLNASMRVDTVRSAQRPTMFLSARAASTRPAPNPLRRGSASGASSKIFGCSFSDSFNILFMLTDYLSAQCAQFVQKYFALLICRNLISWSFAGGVAMPAVIALYLGNAFAGDGVRDDD